MSQLRSRVQKLEASVTPPLPAGFLRIIQHGDLTPDQEAEMACAKAAGKFVIIRKIVEAKPH